MAGLIDPKKLSGLDLQRATDPGSSKVPGTGGGVTSQAGKKNGLMPSMPQALSGTTSLESATDRMVPKLPNGRPSVTSGTPAMGEVDRHGNPIRGVEGRLDSLLSKDSPYLRQARSRAKRTANRRGLMSSSIAAGAGEAAAIDAALPIATADADIASRERGMRSQEFQQGRDIESRLLLQERDNIVRERMQQRGMTHEAAQRDADRELSKLMQERSHRVEQLMQTERLDRASAEAQADREFQDKLDVRRQEFAADQAQRDRQQQKTIATVGAQTAIDETYARMLTVIESNKDLPAEVRKRVVQHLNVVRQGSVDAVASIVNRQVTWDTPARGGDQGSGQQAGQQQAQG